MSFATLTPGEKMRRYARERQRVFDLRRHVRNLNRALSSARVWGGYKSEQVDRWRQMYLDELQRQKCNLPTPHVRTWVPVLTFLVGAILGTVLYGLR
jgi:hypothetical protein